MQANRSLPPVLAVLAAISVPSLQLQAQGDVAKLDQALAKRCVKELVKYSRIAKSKKHGPAAMQALNLVLEYDPDHKAARRDLGFKKMGDSWVGVPPEKRKKWRDKSTYENRFKVLEQKAETWVALGEEHAKAGEKLKAAGNDTLAAMHFQKAVDYNPNNREANLALGHKLCELGQGRSFYGTDFQIAMAKRMLEIEHKAAEFARKEYDVEELSQDDMPKELQNLIDNAPDWMLQPQFEVSGAKSANFTIWARGSQKLANDAVMWAERAIDFMEWLIGEKQAKRLNFEARASRNYQLYCFLATSRERKEFVTANQQILGGRSPEDAMRFANTTWRDQDGGKVLFVGSSPRQIQDRMIAYVAHFGLCAGRNLGIGQGFVHAMTWYLKATSITQWGAIPEGTVGEDGLDLPEGTNWWMRTIRDQAMSKQDWSLGQVPREKLARFRNDCRMKTWSLMTWMIAAYPDKWLEFQLKLPDAEEKVPTLEDVEKVVVDVFNKSSEEIDAEWREWARGDSGVAFGTGYGPPLLPERPSDVEIAALEQINLIRSQECGFTFEVKDGKFEGEWVTLLECEMDAETSIGCDLHSKYITNHPERAQGKDGEIHEEDPKDSDFTRQGQQAGGGNIIWSTGASVTEAYARDSVDGWISAPYHRFPMLQHNIKRLGYAHFEREKYQASVLDMSSLMEPYDPSTAPRFVAWPPNNGQKIPTHFGNPEHPNPLEDQPEDEQDVTKCGYVVSLQLQREISLQLGECDIQIWETRKGKQPTKNFVNKKSAEFTEWEGRCRKEVECYKHTPKVPLNRKRDLRDVLFAIPKEPLRAGKYYQARAYLNIGGNDMVFVWEFGTGRQKQGLKFK